jgi:lipopolysaccharide transport system ATP-binding protein
MPKPLLSVRNVAVAYRKGRKFWGHTKYWALKDVSFDVYPGETLGIIGRNGVGKSTLLKTLAGIYLPDRGNISATDVKVALLTLQLGFAPHLTGRENTILSGLYLGMTHKEIESEIDAVCEFSELGDFFDEQVKNYSMGMKARLGFSVALRIKPDVLLIDETLGVGDADFRKKSTAAIKKLISSNLTVILVSHNPATMRELCNRAVWIEDGVSIKSGSAEKVLVDYERGNK